MLRNRDQWILQQHVASNMSNNAAKLYMENKVSDAFMLYKQSLLLLNELTSMRDQQEAVENPRNPDSYWLSEVRNFSEPIFIPLDSAYDASIAPCSSDFVSLVVMYNLFLVLRKTGQTKDARSFLDLIRNLTERGFESGEFHPTLKLSIQVHLAEIAFDCGEQDEAWHLFVEALRIGQESLNRDLLFATVCARMGGLLMEARYIEEAYKVFQKATEVYESSPMQIVDTDSNWIDDFTAAAA